MTTSSKGSFSSSGTTTTAAVVIPRVRLVWERRRRLPDQLAKQKNQQQPQENADHDAAPNRWHIHLAETQQEKQNDDSSPPPPRHTQSPFDAECVVDLAWQQERQRRKLQHAEKVGRPVTTLDIVYQDESVLVVHKPGGVLTVPGNRQHPSLLCAVHEYINKSNQSNTASSTTSRTVEHMTPTHRIVHRLDMDTSGLVLFGKSLPITKRLQAMFRQGGVVRKTYRAIVVGHWPVAVTTDDDDDNNNNSHDNNHNSNSKQASRNTKDTADNGHDYQRGTIELPLQRDIFHAPFMRVSTPAYDERARQRLEQLHAAGQQRHWVYQAAKPSVTHFRVVRHGWYTPSTLPTTTTTTTTTAYKALWPLPYTVLDLEPWTGRTHQLRVHCAALGFPILGDPTYGWQGEAAPQGGLLGVPVEYDGGVFNPTHCPTLDILQAWNTVWPPNEMPLCLHATSLDLPHPANPNCSNHNVSENPEHRLRCHAPAPFAQFFQNGSCGSKQN